MAAKNPEEICSVIKQYMAESNIDGLLSVYDRLLRSGVKIAS
jgi:pentatricopeptide repeat protein